MGDYWPLGIASEIKWKERFFETGSWEGDFGLLLKTKHADEILGQNNFFKAPVYMDAFDMGFRIYKPENRGNVFMTEALSLVVSYIFETKPIQWIQATLLPGSEEPRSC